MAAVNIEGNIIKRKHAHYRRAKMPIKKASAESRRSLMGEKLWAFTLTFEDLYDHLDKGEKEKIDSMSEKELKAYRDTIVPAMAALCGDCFMQNWEFDLVVLHSELISREGEESD